MKTGLILEGGAMRGLFTAGVLDVLMENGIEFDGAIGVSAGATFGCNIKSRQIGRVIRYNKRFARDWRYCSLRSLLTTGDLYGADFCYNELPNRLDLFDFNTFRTNPMEFYVVASDCATGKPVYKRLDTCDDRDLNWMRASASMPLASRIVDIDGYHLLDGGITDSIPLEHFESIGYDRNVVVLTQPRSYRKSPNRLMWLMRLILKQYPAITSALKNRHIIYNSVTSAIHSRADRGEVLVICPDAPLNISRTSKNPNEMQRVYDEGRRIAIGQIDRIRQFLCH
jgi:predicted patatin/cPLA2 family phospholipase